MHHVGAVSILPVRWHPISTYGAVDPTGPGRFQRREGVGEPDLDYQDRAVLIGKLADRPVHVGGALGRDEPSRTRAEPGKRIERMRPRSAPGRSIRVASSMPRYGLMCLP